MTPGVSIKVLMGTGLEEVLSWKCCNLHGLNMEVQVQNGGAEKLEVKNEVELTGPGGSERVAWLYPPGVRMVEPGEAVSFYGSFDEEKFKRFMYVKIEDTRGQRYQARITGEAELAQRVA